MKVVTCIAALFAFSVPLAAQILPEPVPDNPRLQTAHYAPGQSMLLTMLPETPLTVMLRPGEQVTSVTPHSEDYRVRVSSERDSFVVLPVGGAQPGELEVETPERSYRFALRVGEGYGAALVVRFVDQSAQAPDYDPAPQAVSADTWHYRLKGDRAVRPLAISDDGIKTRISYTQGQALPAVFAIGPTGEEEVVNGYMRDDVFVIDRVYETLVFRIDGDKASAQRNRDPETQP